MSSQDGEASDNYAMCSDSALRQLANLERMIDIMSVKLIQFRDLGLNEFSLSEIRRLEGKLLKHFCQQLCTKGRVEAAEVSTEFRNYPSLPKWLKVVGVSPSVAIALENQDRSVESLLGLSDEQLQRIVMDMGGDAEDVRKLTVSLQQLRKFQSLQQQNRSQQIDMSSVYWDSWSKPEDAVFDHDVNKNVRSDKDPEENGMHSSSGTSRHDSEASDGLPPEPLYKTHRTRSNTDPSNADMPIPLQEDLLPTVRIRQLNSTSSSSCMTPPSPSCRDSRSSLESDSGTSVNRNVPSSSPPPHVSKYFVVPSPSPNNVYTPPVTPRTPPKNPHSQLQSSVSLGAKISRERVASTGAGMPLARQGKIVNPNSLLPTFNPLKPSKSSEWQIGLHIHPLGGENISASNQSLASIASTPSGQTKRKPSKKARKRPANIIINDSEIPNFTGIVRSGIRRSSTTVSPENAPGSTGVSPLSPSTPMTPATPFNSKMASIDREMTARTPLSPGTPKTPKSGLMNKVTTFFNKRFGKKKIKRNKSTEHIPDEPTPPSYPASSHHLHSHSTLTLPTSGSSHSLDEINGFKKDTNRIPAARAISHSGDSRVAPISRPTSLVDTESTLTTDSLTTVVNSTTLGEHEDDPVRSSEEEPEVDGVHDGPTAEEWDIPYSELQIGEKIGSGRVGTVYRGRWHGEVAIRVIEINHNDEETLKAFKQEIMIYKKTRHDNLDLFMGSCMNPPRLAIVTGLCKGQSLHNHIQGLKEKNQTIITNQAKLIGQHIAQGMGYLHSKGIIHKDLKSRNIFYDGKHVVVTDFGLVGLHAVTGERSHRGSLKIPNNWLCHLAPEVIRALRVPEHSRDAVISTLPYTVKSDVFAFGTVWYELLSGSLPFDRCTAESIIWQVGSGKKQILSQLPGGKDTKDILMGSWAYDPSQRLDFSDNGIMGLLKRLQNQILRGSSDPAMSCRDPLTSKPGRRYHPLLSPTNCPRTFAVGTLKF